MEAATATSIADNHFCVGAGIQDGLRYYRYRYMLHIQYREKQHLQYIISLGHKLITTAIFSGFIYGYL